MADCFECGSYLTTEDLIKKAIKCSGSKSALVLSGAVLNQVPVISNVAVSSSTDTGFTVTATVDPKGTLTPVLHYGLTGAYGSTVNATEGEISDTGTVTFVVTGLAQNTLYHYKIVAGVSETADATQSTTNVRWILPVTGQTSGTPTAGTLVFSATGDVAITATGDATVSVVRAIDVSVLKLHTVTVNCPNNGSGSIIIADRSKVKSIGRHKESSVPDIDFYSGVNTTMPIISLNINDIPATVEKIRQNIALSVALPVSGTSDFPSILIYLNLVGSNISWTNSNQLPTGMTYIIINSVNVNWTGLSIGNGNVASQLMLSNYRIAKMSSADMVTLLTQLTNRTGTLPATITINDYANYASPPQTVIDAVAALKLAKTITTVNLGA